MEEDGSMDSMKLRLILMGCILMVLGIVLFVARGNAATLGLAVVGIVLLIVGVVWKPRTKAAGARAPNGADQTTLFSGQLKFITAPIRALM